MSFVRNLEPGQRCRVHVFDLASGEDHVIYETNSLLLEAPNWHKDGQLILNGDGVLWRLDASGNGELEPVVIDGVPELNNDHVLSPDHALIYMSAYDDWQIYVAPATGGQAKRVTNGEPGVMHFLHGVSPDGHRLAYVRMTMRGEMLFDNGHIHLLDLTSGKDVSLTTATEPEDGSEFSADGNWVYLNTEHFSRTPGHAQIARVNLETGQQEQLTFDERVNWFPHLAPNGRDWVYLSYPAGTQGHPENLPVELRLVTDDSWATPTILVKLFGGQGTINVNSWSPDSDKFAYVSYPKE